MPTSQCSEQLAVTVTALGQALDLHRNSKFDKRGLERWGRSGFWTQLSIPVLEARIPKLRKAYLEFGEIDGKNESWLHVTK